MLLLSEIKRRTMWWKMLGSIRNFQWLTRPTQMATIDILIMYKYSLPSLPMGLWELQAWVLYPGLPRQYSCLSLPEAHVTPLQGSKGRLYVQVHVLSLLWLDQTFILRTYYHPIILNQTWATGNCKGLKTAWDQWNSWWDWVWSKLQYKQRKAT